jgi:hypothetical protein
MPVDDGEMNRREFAGFLTDVAKRFQQIERRVLGER